jgi:hypothetical protein
MDARIKTEKRPWQKPELIVLVRSQPEEAVLTGCKNPSASKVWATSTNYFSLKCTASPAPCKTCAGVGASS